MRILGGGNRLLAGLAIALALLPQAAGAMDLSDNYLCDFPQSDARVYQLMRWMPAELPIKIYLPGVPVNFKVSDPQKYVGIVQKAFNTWSQVAPAFKFQYVDSPNAAQIVVSWREYFPEDEGAWGEALLPKPFLNAKGELRHKSEMHLAIKAQPGSAVGSVGAVPFSYEEMLAIAIHEAGHTLGMPHSRNGKDIMATYLHRDNVKPSWVVTQRDINTLFFLYSLPKELKKHPCADD